MVSTELLRHVPLFSSLDAQGLAALAAAAAIREVPRKTLLFAAGDAADGAYVVVSGQVKVFISDPEGREVILAMLGPGEHFGEMGLLDDQPRSASVEAAENSALLHLDRAGFLRCIASNPGCAVALLRVMSLRLREADRQIEGLALLDVEARVMRLLEDLSQNLEGRRVIRKAPSKQDIARMVGASREMVSRVMRELEEAGRIRPSGQAIVIA